MTAQISSLLGLDKAASGDAVASPSTAADQPHALTAGGPGVQTTISPIDGQPVVIRQLLSDSDVAASVGKSVEAGKAWRLTSLEERKATANKFLDLVEARQDALALEITEQMGRPIKFAHLEIAGFVSRSRYMISIADEALAEVDVTGEQERKEGKFKKSIRRERLGVIFIISAWNFPYLIQSNTLLPALLAGNTLLLKPSPQTPTSSEQMSALLLEAGLPKDVCQTLHLTLDQMDSVVRDPRVASVAFTGSVENGRRVGRNATAGEGFKSVGLELGGKDPAYVRKDADPVFAATELADGAFFNSGQSCCSVERIYVHESIYDAFIIQLAKEAGDLKLGDPREKETSLGPVISIPSAAAIRKQIAEALSQGARTLIPEEVQAKAAEGTTYVAPQVLVDVNHTMAIMTEETFGPVVGVMKVKTDEEAVALMNDSRYGLTASIWTNDADAFNDLVSEVDAGTVFMNRCDFLAPELAWTGVKDSGRGISLSKYGYDQLTRAKTGRPLKQSGVEASSSKFYTTSPRSELVTPPQGDILAPSCRPSAANSKLITHLPNGRKGVLRSGQRRSVQRLSAPARLRRSPTGLRRSPAGRLLRPAPTAKCVPAARSAGLQPRLPAATVRSAAIPAAKLPTAATPTGLRTKSEEARRWRWHGLPGLSSGNVRLLSRRRSLPRLYVLGRRIKPPHTRSISSDIPSLATPKEHDIDERLDHD
ncbi:hypothetical protein E5Q_02202 [Mixia osmundae IAM 14324]|uniref:Aldehyde dehydrogenase domain-containing protein n=1 Tax=Mixia osmundae (strain CBS 9802 / IAM 14324 / JCM 22182 / KY 12970) TaxID=764103 RepID=G7DY87_MIXOS|nr:hypothetical protein E5Q_02202 [Mixia osmundae IAM 14324]